MKTLGQRIRELRDGQDLSLRELARKLNLSAAYLSDIELGRRFPSEKVFADLARELNVAVDELRDHDTRAPIEGLKRLSESNPMYGLAFRRLVDSKTSPEELIKLAGKAKRGKKA